MTTDDVAKALRQPKETPMSKGVFASFGSTLLNLGVTGNPRHGLEQGTYCLLVGGSNSGKTFLALTMMAEVSINPEFDSHSLIYNGPENGAIMDVHKCFGPNMADRLQLLTPGNGASSSPEEFYDHFEDTAKSGPTVYVLDSMDALMPKDEEEQVAKERKGREGGKEVTGSYGTAKAKINSSRLRVANLLVTGSGSILVIISQTRDNIGFGAMFNPETRSGGKALAFYAQVQIWLKRKQTLDKSFKGKDVQVGGITQAKVKRTRFTGQEWDVEFPIYHSTGLDDIESCIRWLVEWKHWKGDKSKLVAPEFGFVGTIEQLCQEISNTPKYQVRLRKTTFAHWKVVAEATRVERTSKYDK